MTSVSLASSRRSGCQTARDIQRALSTTGVGKGFRPLPDGLSGFPTTPTSRWRLSASCASGSSANSSLPKKSTLKVSPGSSSAPLLSLQLKVLIFFECPSAFFLVTPCLLYTSDAADDLLCV